MNAKARATETERKAKIEVARLSKEVAAKRTIIKQFQKQKNESLKLEEKERQKVAVAQKEFETVRAELDEAKRAKEEATENLKRANDMYREEQRRIKVARLEIENTKKQTQNIKRREASVLQKLQKPKKPMPQQATVVTPKSSKVPNLSFVSQDCNMRSEPSGKSDILKKVLKGQRVMILGSQGSWIVVGTPQVPKGFMNKMCF